jgi:hypothetical protein
MPLQQGTPVRRSVAVRSPWQRSSAESRPSSEARTRAALAKLLDGDTTFDVPKGRTIPVTADKVACHASNIDIAEHDCTLTFGKQDVTLKGRAAHELYATLLEAGVQPDPGAGNIWVSVSKLDCAINVAEVKEKAGGGATCHYAADD